MICEKRSWKGKLFLWGGDEVIFYTGWSQKALLIPPLNKELKEVREEPWGIMREEYFSWRDQYVQSMWSGVMWPFSDRQGELTPINYKKWDQIPATPHVGPWGHCKTFTLRKMGSLERFLSRGMAHSDFCFYSIILAAIWRLKIEGKGGSRKIT